MAKKLCNRCGDRYSKTTNRGGQLELKHGKVEIDADLCRDCYSDILEKYEEE